MKTPKQHPLPNWNKVRKGEVWFEDGDVLMLATWAPKIVEGEEPTWAWRFDHVRADCDGENFQLLQAESGENHGDEWWSATFYMQLNSVGPLTKAQARAHFGFPL